MKLKLVFLLLVISQCIKAQTLTASFSFSVSCNTVCCTSTSISTPWPIVSYVWDFGDGSFISNTQNPCHDFYTAGSYLVRLIVTNANADSDTISQIVTIDFPVSSLTYTNASCNGICDGSAAIVTSGGIPPYTYSSQPPAIGTANPTNL